jgi:hypothetical protein
MKKKEEPIVATTKATPQNYKVQKIRSYACHIYGWNGHSMTNCPKFAKMHKML